MALLGNSAYGLHPQAPPPAPGWSPAAAAAGLMRRLCGRSQGAVAVVADWLVPYRAGQKEAGCRQRIGTNQGGAGRAHLGDKAKGGGAMLIM